MGDMSDMSETDEINRACAPGVELQEFVRFWVPVLYARYGDLARVSDIEPIVCLGFENSMERYTVQFFRDGSSQVEGGEGIDFPVATILLNSRDWPALRDLIRRWLPEVNSEWLRLSADFRWTTAKASRYEAIDGLVEVTISGDQVVGGLMKLSFLLNNYVLPKGAKQCAFTFDESLIGDLVEDRISVAQWVDGFDMTGDLGLSTRLLHLWTH